MLIRTEQVYVGFFSHAAFPEKNDRTRTTAFNTGKHTVMAKQTLRGEYRYYYTIVSFFLHSTLSFFSLSFFVSTAVLLEKKSRI